MCPMTKINFNPGGSLLKKSHSSGDVHFTLKNGHPDWAQLSTNPEQDQLAESGPAFCSKFTDLNVRS